MPVVISCHEHDFQSLPAPEPGFDRLHYGGSPSRFCMEKITQYHEVSGFPFTRDPVEGRDIVVMRSLRNRNSGMTERGGLPEVGVGDKQCFSPWPPDRFFRQQRQLFTGPFEGLHRVIRHVSSPRFSLRRIRVAPPFSRCGPPIARCSPAPAPTSPREERKAA